MNIGNLKLYYGKILYGISKIAGVDFSKKFDTYFRFKRKLDLKKPKTLADKVSYIELHEQSPMASMCTDKYAVRQYVMDKGFEDILVPVVAGPWNTAEEVDFSILPNSFALKATHGCKMNYIVPDKDAMDQEHCLQEMKKWMATTYGTYSMEPHYLDIPHRIYAEKFLENTTDLIDYKFHCLNGVPQFVLVCSERNVREDARMQVTLDLFDMEWKPIYELKADGAEVPGNGNIDKPHAFGEMIEIAKKLSEDFKFVRVDLYELDGKVYFGELTFSPACCVFPYFTEKFNEEMGEKLTI